MKAWTAVATQSCSIKVSVVSTALGLKRTQEGTFGCKSALTCDRADHKVGHSRQSMQTGSHARLVPQTVHKDIEHCPEYLGAFRLEIVPEFAFRAPIPLLNRR